MKKLFITVIFAIVLFSASIFSQTERGTWLVGGGANTGFTFSENNTSFSLGISPNIGIFVAKGFALGLSFNTSGGFSTNTNGSTPTTSTSFNYGFAPFMRFYFATTSRTSLFIPASIGEGGWATTFPDGSHTTSQSSTYIYGETGLGFAFFMKPSVAFETALLYNYNKYKDADPTSRIGLRFGFQIHLKRAK